jgi:apolipoprotein D and lipocalin family protein
MAPPHLSSIILYFPLFLVILIGCSVSKEMSTEFIPVVQSFDIQRYLGTWYEVGRLPNSFEKGLVNVTATYSLRDDSIIAVVNKGFDTTKGKWKEAQGKARFKERGAGALLEVSFFWIFYADYKVIELDTVNYSFALVTSSSKEYLWILSRTPHLDDYIYNALIRKADEWGFNMSAIIKVPH